MPATFLYTLLLGIIYLVKKNWNTIPASWRSDFVKEGKKQLSGDTHREATSRVVMDSIEERTARQEVVAELA